MGTITSLTSGIATGITATETVVNEDGTINKEGRNNLIGTTIAGTATTIGGAIVSDYDMQQIYQKYSSSYIESLSDEELANALEQLDLLESKINDNNTSKTI